MKPSMETFATKIDKVFNDNRVWKGFFVWYLVLLAADLLLAAFTEQKRKTSMMNAVSVGVGLGITWYHLKRTGGWKAENR